MGCYQMRLYVELIFVIMMVIGLELKLMIDGISRLLHAWYIVLFVTPKSRQALVSDQGPGEMAVAPVCKKVDLRSGTCCKTRTISPCCTCLLSFCQRPFQLQTVHTSLMASCGLGVFQNKNPCSSLVRANWHPVLNFSSCNAACISFPRIDQVGLAVATATGPALLCDNLLVRTSHGCIRP